MIYDIVETTNAPLRFQLLENGSPIDLTNCKVDLLLEDVSGTTVAGSPVTTVVNAVNGTVQFDPVSTGFFDASIAPFYARWKITDISSRISYVPSTGRDVWNIVGV